MKKLLSLLLAGVMSCSIAFAQDNTQASLEVFGDVPVTHQYVNAIYYLAEVDYIDPYNSTNFHPGALITRADAYKLVTLGSGIVPNVRLRSCFTDVQSQSFAPYVCYAKLAGWTEGYGDGSFRPTESLTKKDAVELVVKAFGIGNTVQAGFAAAVVPGTIKNFTGSDAISRGELSEIVFRAMVRQEAGAPTYIHKDLVSFHRKHDLRNVMEYTVVEVVSGDTLRVENSLGAEEEIRLLGVDAPKPDEGGIAGECHGEEAKNALAEILEGQMIRTEKDIYFETEGTYKIDYAYVYLRNTLNVNKYIVSKGLAYVGTPKGQNFGLKAFFEELEDKAQEEKRGLWSDTTCKGKREFPSFRLEVATGETVESEDTDEVEEETTPTVIFDTTSFDVEEDSYTGETELPQVTMENTVAIKALEEKLALYKRTLRGADSSPVTVVTFVDYESPEAEQYFDVTYPYLKSNYIDPKKITYYSIPVTKYTNTYAGFMAVMAARCAEEQDKLYEMQEILHDLRDEWITSDNREFLLSIEAEMRGLESKSLMHCAASFTQYLPMWNDQELLAGLTSHIVPTVIINGKIMDRIDPKTLNNEIEQFLK